MNMRNLRRILVNKLLKQIQIKSKLINPKALISRLLTVVCIKYNEEPMRWEFVESGEIRVR